MAKSFREGTGWSFRLRVKGQDEYRSGFPSEAAANKAQEELRVEIRQQGSAVGSGPFRTSVAGAFTIYAKKRLPYLKGALPDSRIINRYLRAMNLPVIRLSPADQPAESPKNAKLKVYWNVTFVHEPERRIPNSLKAHRNKQHDAARKCDAKRRQLAGTMVAEVTAYQIQALINEMIESGYKSSTIANERAELRRLFAYTKNQLNWARPTPNPAAHVDMPTADGARDTVLTNQQWQRLSIELCKAGNPYAPALCCLMLETAMRSCEPLTIARWNHVNWTRKVLVLPDAKAGKREVPLSPSAIAILKTLEERAKAGKQSSTEPWSPTAKIFPTTYEAVKKAWATARKACNVSDEPIGDVRMHDLRHTAATRYSLEYKGNLPVIMLITGHKTPAMAMRYINIKADLVAQMMHGMEPDIAQLPAGYRASNLEALEQAQDALAPPDHKRQEPESGSKVDATNVIQLAVHRKAA